MTLATTTSTAGPFLCNGVVVAYPYAWRILADDEIEVTLITPTGERTTLAKTTDYTVTGVGNTGGGNVETLATYEDGYSIFLRRKPPLSQTSEFQNQGAYNAETHEEAFDKLAMQVQFVRDEAARAVKAPLGSEPFDVPDYGQLVLDVAAEVGEAAVALIDEAADGQVERLEGEADEQIARINDTAADVGTTLAVAASARIFTDPAAQLAATADGEGGWQPQTFGVQAELYVEKSSSLVHWGRTMLLGTTAIDAALEEKLIRTVGDPLPGTFIDIDFGDLRYTDGRVARNKMATMSPVMFTFVRDQAVTVDALSAGSLDYWATKRFNGNATVYLEVEVTEAAATGGAGGQVSFAVVESDNADLSSNTTIVPGVNIGKGTLVVGYKYRVPIPATATKRYIGVYIDVTTGPLTAGKFTFRTVSYNTAPIPNYIVFDQGAQLRNQASGPTIGSLAGGVRQITFASNQQLKLNVDARVAPTGVPWTMEVVAQGGTGSGGGQVIRYGPSDAYETSGSLAEGVSSTLVKTFAGSDNGLPVITTTSGGTANIGLVRVRACEGSILPDYVEDRTHAYSSGARRGGLTRRGSFMDPQGGAGNKATIIRKSGFARQTIDPRVGFCTFVSVYVPAGSASPTINTDTPFFSTIYDNYGSPTISTSDYMAGLDTFVHTVGELTVRPDQAGTRETGYVEPQPGWHIIAVRYRQEGVQLWHNGVPILRSYSPRGNMDIVGYWLSAAANSMNMMPTSYQFPGGFQNFVEIPYAPTDDQMLQEFERIRQMMAVCGRTLAVDKYTFFAPGTSITAWQNIPSWFWQLARVVRPVNADGTNRFMGVNCANGGQSYHNVSAIRSIVSATRTAGAISIQTSVAHGYGTGAVIHIEGVHDVSFNGSYTTTTGTSGTTINVTGFATDADVTTSGGTVQEHSDDFFTVLYRELVPGLKGCAWSGSTPVVIMPDYANDADFIGKLAGASAPTGAPSWWNTSKAGYQNVYDGYVVPYVDAIRAAGPSNTLIVEKDPWPRADAFGTSSGYTETGRLNLQALLRAATWWDHYVDHDGTPWASAADAVTAGYLSADNLHDSSTGSLAKAQRLNDRCIARLP